jgi:hypothetical protein
MLRLSVCTSREARSAHVESMRNVSIVVFPLLFANVASSNIALQIAKSAEPGVKAWPPLAAQKYEEPQLWLVQLLQCRVR